MTTAFSLKGLKIRMNCDRIYPKLIQMKGWSVIMQMLKDAIFRDDKVIVNGSFHPRS